MTGYDYDPDNRLLDRMVDSELTEHEQRELLVRLDNRGWRKLALAYVESQTWHGALASLAKDRVEPKRRDPTPMTRTRLSSFSLTTLAIGFLLAVGLGYLFDFVPRDRGETNIIVNETRRAGCIDSNGDFIRDFCHAGGSPGTYVARRP